MLHEPGRFMSYCNSGFPVLGSLIETLRDTTWDAAIRERISQPLGLTRTCTLPEEVLLHRAAVGHEKNFDGSQQPAGMWGIPRAAGPAGLITQTVEDLLAFAAMHIDDGRDVLSAESARAMRDVHAIGGRGIARSRVEPLRVERCGRRRTRRRDDRPARVPARRARAPVRVRAADEQLPGVARPSRSAARDRPRASGPRGAGPSEPRRSPGRDRRRALHRPLDVAGPHRRHRRTGRRAHRDARPARGRRGAAAGDPADPDDGDRRRRVPRPGATDRHRQRPVLPRSRWRPDGSRTPTSAAG